MADVFVSYSRSDKEFVGRLADGLKGRGKDVWIDVDGIRDAERFPEALKRAIEGSDAFVFIISPDSVASAFCEQEVQHAAVLNKRIVPVELRPVADDELPDEVRYRNWIAVESAGTPPTERVLTAIDTDLDWEQRHTRLMVRALEWDGSGRDRSFLLRGSDLAAAERWLTEGAGKDPGPTALEQEYVLSARQAAARRQRLFVGSSLAVAAVAVALLVFALISRGQAVSAETSAKAQALAAESLTQQSIDPELSILLAEAAVRDRVTYGENGTMFALRAAIDASTIRFRLPALPGARSCGITAAFDLASSSHRLAVGLCSNHVVLASDATGRIERSVTVPGTPANAVHYLADGSGLVVMAGKRVLELNSATGALLRETPVIRGVLGFSVDPRAPIVAIAAPTQLDFWDLRSGRLTVTRPAQLRALSVAWASSFTYNADGRQLLVTLAPPLGSSAPGLVLYDIAQQRVIATGLTAVSTAAFSADGRWLAAAELNTTGGTVVRVNARTLALDRHFRPITVPQVTVTVLAFSPDSRSLAYGLADGAAGLASANSGARIDAYLGDTTAISSESFSPDGKLVLTSSSDGAVRAWRAGGLARRTISASAAGGEMQADPGGFVVSGAQDLRTGPGLIVQRWLDDGQPAAPPLVLSRNLKTAAGVVAAGGRFALLVHQSSASGRRWSLQIWDIAARRLVRTLRHEIPSLNGTPAISADGRYVAIAVQPPFTGPAALTPTYLVLLDTVTGRSRTLGRTTCSQGWDGLAFSHDDRLLAGGTFCGDHITVWNVATGHQLGASLSLGGEMSQTAFRPDSRQLAIPSWDGRILVTPVPIPRDGRGIQTLTEDHQGVPIVAYSPDGRYLASGGLDHTVRVFDAHTLQELRVIAQPRATNQLAFADDSRNILSALSNNSGVSLWDACTDCESPAALLSLARTRVTRSLTPAERQEFGTG
jgi:WD40 repeat protein